MNLLIETIVSPRANVCSDASVEENDTYVFKDMSSSDVNFTPPKCQH